jgi:hypothetical protein
MGDNNTWGSAFDVEEKSRDYLFVTPLVFDPTDHVMKSVDGGSS